MAAILQSAQWIPPDRDLALRGQIKTGWSTLAARKPNRYVANGTGELTDEELETIQTVISKADVLERKEHIRIGLLSLQYEQLCSNARGNGDTSCIICGYDFVVPKSRVTIQLHICQACTRAVCSRCKADYKKSSGEIMVLCRLCYDSRELWKKSGAWLMNGSLPPVVMVSKEELEKIQMTLIPSINKRGKLDTVAMQQEAQNSDNDEEDQSYIGLQSILKRGEAQGLSRRKVVRKRSPRGTMTRGGSPGIRDVVGAGGSSNLDVGESHTSTHQHHSREGTPQIVIESPTPDVTRTSEDLLQPISVPPSAYQSSHPATLKQDPNPTATPPEPSPGGQVSPSHEGFTRLDGDGLQPYHRRSKVIRKRGGGGGGAMSHSKSTEEFATSVPSRATGSAFEDSRPLDTQSGAVVRPIEVFKTQEEGNDGFKKTRPRLQFAMVPAGQDVAEAPTREDITIAPTDGMVKDSEFKRVKVAASSEGAVGHDPAGKEVASVKMAEDSEFRKVRMSPSPHHRASSDVNVSHELEGSPVSTGDEFRKVKLNALSHQTTLDVSLGSVEKFSMNDQVRSGEEVRKVEIVSEKPAEVRMTQQLPNRRVEPQTDNLSKTEKEEERPPSPHAISHGSLSRDSPSENTPSVQNVTKRRVVQSLQTEVGERDTLKMSHKSKGSSPPAEHPVGGLEGADGKKGIARVQLSTDDTLGAHEDSTVLSASVQSESSVQEEEEEGKLQASQGGTDDDPQGDEEQKRTQHDRQRPQWKRRQAMSRRARTNDEDDQEAGPRPRSRVISATSEASPRRPLVQSHDNGSPAGDNV
ncbi:hypothetical protein EMCRGX_G023967 [Ephydatia muelleri]